MFKKITKRISKYPKNFVLYTDTKKVKRSMKTASTRSAVTTFNLKPRLTLMHGKKSEVSFSMRSFCETI